MHEKSKKNGKPATCGTDCADKKNADEPALLMENKEAESLTAQNEKLSEIEGSEGTERDSDLPEEKNL